MKLVLPVIVLSQFLCTSMWFAGNAVTGDIVQTLHLQSSFLATLTSIIQLGFITGTLVFAILGFSDRYSPSVVFFVSSILAGIFNLCMAIGGADASVILLCRFLTGFFLAGIYPVGMKIASDYYKEGLGTSLGFLVGALVLGTAFPHLLKTLSIGLHWKYVIYATTALSFAGGLAVILFVRDGPYRKQGQRLAFAAFMNGFRQPDFRSVAFGYFGHMWELYTFWAFVPVMLAAYARRYSIIQLNVPLCSFLVIASGGLACVISGLLSRRYGAKRIATIALSISCLCCLLSPLFLFVDSFPLFILFLLLWGTTVIADSPLFSTMVARHAPEAFRGSLLTIVNCIGFAITIVSIQCISYLSGKIDVRYIYVSLAIGPVPGLFALWRKRNSYSAHF